MEQTPTTKQALTQKARGRPHTMINVDAAASTEASSHPPSVPVPPIKSPANGSNSPAGHASAHRGAVTASQSATKRGLLSAEATRPAKLAKGSSPTPVRPGAQVARTGRPLAAARGPGLGVRHTVRMRAEDPWTRYKKLYEIMLDDFTTVAVHKDKSYDPVIVRNFREDKAIAARTKTLHEIRHENLLVLLESFSFKGYRYLIFERISVSLVEVVACPHSPSVHELVAVIGQVSSGACCLVYDTDVYRLWLALSFLNPMASCTVPWVALMCSSPPKA
jgi:hypothetical protein